MLPDEYAYILIYNKIKEYETLFYSLNSDISIDVQVYKKKDNLDFLKLIQNDENYKENFVFYKGSSPRNQLIERKTDLDENHYVLRLLAKEKTEIIFSIYDPL